MLTLEMAIQKIQQLPPEQRNKVIEYIESLELQTHQQQEKQPETSPNNLRAWESIKDASRKVGHQDSVEVAQVHQQHPFNPRSFFGVAHQPKQVIDDYLTTAREGWL